MKTVPKPHNPVLHLPLTVLILLGASLIAIACGGGSIPANSLELVPDDSSWILVLNVDQILRGDVPEQLEDKLEDDWEDELNDRGVSIDDLRTIVIASGQYQGGLFVVEGEIDFEEARDELDDVDYDDDRYQGYEVWEGGTGLSESVALLEDRGQMVIGITETVEDALNILSRGSGSLRDVADSALGRALRMAGEGWMVEGREGCQASGVRGCLATGVAYHRGNEDYRVEVTLAYLFRNERTAESEMDDLEDAIDDNLSRDYDIEEVRVDGEFVFVTVSVDEDDWDINLRH